MRCTPAQRTPFLTTKGSSRASASADADETIAESSFREVLGVPKSIPNWKRAFGRMPSSPTRDRTRGAGEPAPRKATPLEQTHTWTLPSGSGPHKHKVTSLQAILQQKGSDFRNAHS